MTIPPVESFRATVRHTARALVGDILAAFAFIAFLIVLGWR